MTGQDAADRATALIETQVGADNVACVLIEPIFGEGGFIVPAPGFGGPGGYPVQSATETCAQAVHDYYTGSWTLNP